MGDVGVLVFFNDTATTEIYTLSLHDALPSSGRDLDGDRLRDRHRRHLRRRHGPDNPPAQPGVAQPDEDRKSTRLNSSHAHISYAVFCLKKNHVPHLPCASPFLALISHDLPFY